MLIEKGEFCYLDGSIDGQINLKSQYTRELERAAERERAGTCATAAPAAAPAAQSYAAAAAQPPAYSLTIWPAKRGRRKAAPRVDRNALSARGDGVPPRRSRSSSPDAPPAKRASSAGSSVCGYDSEAPEEIQNEALYRACRAYGLGEQFLAAAQDEGTFGEWLDELPFEVAAATARLLKHHARSGAWVELSPGNPSQASRAGRDRDRSSPNCPSDMSELSENSD